MRDDHWTVTGTGDESGAGTAERIGNEPATGEGAPAAITVPLNVVAPLGVTLPGQVGDTVEIINNLREGALTLVVPGVPAGARARTYELAALPDAGLGNLGLPTLVAVPRAGAVTSVIDNGQPAGGGAATGVSLSGGAYLQTVDPVSSTLQIGGGWALSFSLRVPTGARNSGKAWVSFGRRADVNVGLTVTENASGALIATFDDPRYAQVRAQSAPLPRDVIVAMRLVWDAATATAQWRVNGVASGTAAALPYRPQFAGASIQVGVNLALSASANPVGAIYALGFEARGADETLTFAPVGASATLSAGEVAGLRVDTRGVLTPVEAAGDVTFYYNTAGGPDSTRVDVGYGGFVAPVEALTSRVSADMPYTPLAMGGTDPANQVLVLTPPAKGRLESGGSRVYPGVGAIVGVGSDGNPARSFVQYNPGGGGTGAGLNPNGSLARGATDLLRTQEDDEVRTTAIVEMNRAPRLNGGGEAWGHADDGWVPIHALLNGYLDGTYFFPTIDGETPTVTVLEVPAAGEGGIRLSRTGPNLAVGATVPWGEVKRLGWSKPGVSAVRAACRLRLGVAAPGSPQGVEDYALRITDAPRPAGMDYWLQADALYTDRYARVRWANRGGDWAGTDGLYGAVPFATSALVRSAGPVTFDVTAMVKAFGPEAFIATAAATGSVAVTPGLAQPLASEPILTVTGGARAGTYRPTRSAPLYDSDSRWKPLATTPASIKRGQPLLLAFDGAGTAAALAGATRIELTLSVTGTSAGGAALQVFRPAPQPMRPGPRVAVPATPTTSRSDLICKVDTDAEWLAMLNNADSRNVTASGQPSSYTVAGGCYYGAIPVGRNVGLSLRKAFWKVDGSGYERVRMGRMIGWHRNYQPADGQPNPDLRVSGKSAGVLATGSGSLSEVGSGFGGRAVSGYGGYTCRSQRGGAAPANHPNAAPIARFMAYGDYNYFLSGSANGVTTNTINPVPRMQWVWIETVHGLNTINPDGTWAADGVFECYMNGRKQCESRRLEYRVAGNSWLWDGIWFDEYNGGTTESLVDRPWPFCVGPTYVVAGDTPIAPPPGFAAPFVTADGRPETVGSPYVADIV